MIEKERLEELIEEGEKIWSITNGRVVCFPTSKRDYFDARLDGTIIYSNDKYNADLRLENLYKTQEDAEFVSKYHTTRVERFEPPTYEEFIDEDFYFYWFIAKSTQRARIYKKDNSIFVELGVDENLYEFQLNKEGYIKAVEMAYKLFKGEE